MLILVKLPLFTCAIFSYELLKQTYDILLSIQCHCIHYPINGKLQCQIIAHSIWRHGLSQWNIFMQFESILRQNQLNFIENKQITQFFY